MYIVHHVGSLRHPPFHRFLLVLVWYYWPFAGETFGTSEGSYQTFGEERDVKLAGDYLRVEGTNRTRYLGD